MFNVHNNQKGFTLIEALIAIFIFSVALVSLITVMSRGVTGVAQARDQVTAQFLAQEGIEMFRNYRDTRIIEEDTSSLDTMPCDQFNPCYIKYVTSGNQRFVMGSGPSIYLTDQGNNKYEPTNTGKFQRIIYWTPTGHTDKIDLHVEVTWFTGAINRTVHLVSTLTNWGKPSI